MNQDKMHLINKIFNNETIRTVWDKEEGNELVTNCHQLKLKSSDGKYYNTDVVDIKGIQNRKSKYNMPRMKKLLTDLGEGKKINKINVL